MLSGMTSLYPIASINLEGFGVKGLWFVVCGLWFGVCGLGFVVWGLWFVVRTTQLLPTHRAILPGGTQRTGIAACRRFYPVIFKIVNCLNLGGLFCDAAVRASGDVIFLCWHERVCCVGMLLFCCSP